MAMTLLGFKQIHMEKQVGSLGADLYIEDIDMLVCIDGPGHFKNNSLIPIDSTVYSDKIFKKYHKHIMRIDYVAFDKVYMTENEYDYKEGAEFLKKNMESYFKGIG